MQKEIYGQCTLDASEDVVLNFEKVEGVNSIKLVVNKKDGDVYTKSDEVEFKLDDENLEIKDKVYSYKLLDLESGDYKVELEALSEAGSVVAVLDDDNECGFSIAKSDDLSIEVVVSDTSPDVLVQTNVTGPVLYSEESLINQQETMTGSTTPVIEALGHAESIEASSVSASLDPSTSLSVTNEPVEENTEDKVDSAEENGPGSGDGHENGDAESEESEVIVVVGEDENVDSGSTSSGGQEPEMTAGPL